MNARTEVRTIEQDGVKYALLPYDDYLALSRLELARHTGGIPAEIVRAIIIDQVNPVHAWRQYLLLTQAELAARMGITQPALAQIEAATKPRKVTLKKVADALGIRLDQLHV